MDGPRDYHTKSERERQILFAITYTWNLKYNTNEYIYQAEKRLANAENRPVVAKGGGGREGRRKRVGLADENQCIQDG